MMHLLLKAGLTVVSQFLTPRLVTLVYHRVLSEPDPMYPYDLTTAEFDAHMQWVSGTFHVLSMRDAIERLLTHRLPARAVCVTFDDGYLNTLTMAAPVLKRYRIPATVFVCTSCLDSRIMWNDQITEGIRSAPSQILNLKSLGMQEYELTDNNRPAIARRIIADAKYLAFGQRTAVAERLFAMANGPISDPMLSADNIRQLQAEGIEIGCHTHTHPILSRIDDAAARSDIKLSKRMLEDVTKSSIDFFAYPNGHPHKDFSRSHVEIVRELGFLAAFTADGGAAQGEDDRFQLPRFAPWDHSQRKYVTRLGLNYLKSPVLTKQ